MSRRWLIVVSLVAHAAVAAGVFISGVWRIERLHADPRVIHDLHTPTSPPAPSGGPVAATTAPVTPKPPTQKPPVIVQPPVTPPKPGDSAPSPSRGETTGAGAGSGAQTSTGVCVENCVEAPPADPVCGNGAREGGEQCDDGNARDGDGCSASCQIEPKPQKAWVIAPNVLQGLRISGETAIHPSSATQALMLRDGATDVTAALKVCVATDGRTSASIAASTKYADYDAKLLAAAREWQYRPYTLNGVPVPACSMVTFHYRIR
jgi:TonB family protein